MQFISSCVCIQFRYFSAYSQREQYILSANVRQMPQEDERRGKGAVETFEATPFLPPFSSRGSEAGRAPHPLSLAARLVINSHLAVEGNVYQPEGPLTVFQNYCALPRAAEIRAGSAPTHVLQSTCRKQTNKFCQIFFSFANKSNRVTVRFISITKCVLAKVSTLNGCTFIFGLTLISDRTARRRWFHPITKGTKTWNGLCSTFNGNRNPIAGNVIRGAASPQGSAGRCT
ncbi:hypothetical protein PUN28_018050 [Cardiocondyla obscurior]|uniref:Uncharacterized protein n=1 Tax=Cardiocondyla obscurior TaxID=286306 RepID=A0AAW2EFL1_9HYME